MLFVIAQEESMKHLSTQWKKSKYISPWAGEILVEGNEQLYTKTYVRTTQTDKK